jgi:hypothetical protein
MAFITPDPVDPGDVLSASKYNQDVVENTLVLSRGVIAVAKASSVDQTSITTIADVTGCSVTFTAEANRYYVAVGFVVDSASSGSPALQTTQITNSAASVVYAREITHFTAGGGNLHTSQCESEPLTFAAGSTTLKLRFGRSGGDAATYTVNNSTQPAWIAVYDAGAV